MLGHRIKETSPTGDVLVGLKVGLNERMLVIRHGRAARNDPFFGHGTEAVSLYYADINSLESNCERKQ